MRSIFKFMVITFFTTFMLYANTDIFSNCTPLEIERLKTAHKEAIALAKETSSADTKGERYTTWFGEPNDSREKKVLDNFKKIYSVLQEDIHFACNLYNINDDNAYALTPKETSYQIIIGEKFFTLDKSTIRSQEGILLHEASHFDEATNFIDYNDTFYGISYQVDAYEEIKELAKDNPDEAIKNPINYEYFANNTLSLSTGCFIDVDIDTPYKKEICKLKPFNIVEGYDDESYKPMKKINRAEFIKMILLTKYDYKTEIKNSFTIEFPDVAEDAWFVEYLGFARNKGFIDGYKDGEFKAGNLITFAQASKIISKIVNFNLKEKDCTNIIEKCHWADNFMEKIRKLAPSSKYFGNDETLTRGQMAYILIQIGKRIGN